GRVRRRGTRRRPPATRRRGDGQRWGGGVLLEGCGALCCGGVVGSGSGAGWTGAGAGTFPSSTERGAALFDDMTASTSETTKKIPAHHHVIFVSSVVAWRPPMNCSVPAPPPSDANPPPCPACSMTAVVRINASRAKRNSSRLYIAPGNYLRGAGLHKLRPALGIERRSAHQHAVQLAFGEQLGDVLRVHAAAVQDARTGGAAPPEPGADLPMHRRGVARRGVAPGPDRPHRLVGDDETRE